VHVYFEGSELNDVTQFHKRVSSLLDELSKVEEAVINTPISEGGSFVAFGVKDRAPYEKQATLQALDKARPLTDAIARRMKVQITGVEWSVTPSDDCVTGLPSNFQEKVPYEFCSSSIDEVPVRVRVEVRYTYK
jgi:uncharacterized protein YggE